MTNFDYIMSKMTERNFADIFCNPNSMVFDDLTLGDQIERVFTKWRHSLCCSKLRTQVMFNGLVTNVFDCNNYAWHYPKLQEKFRKNNLSFQVWLSKPYNPEEWRDN